MIIRPASERDVAPVRAIWNHVIRDTLYSFNSIEKSEADVREAFTGSAAQNRAFLVAEIEGRAVGFATYFPFRGGIGYARTMEHTVMLEPAAHGRGAGRALMNALEAHAADEGIHSLFAGVSAENPSGLGFHEAVGYRAVARLKEVGFKNGQWLDLVLMQKFLPNPA